jgi:hypothetical protein
VRHCRPAKQRLWLGSHWYRGSCRHAITNPNAQSYANSNGYAFSVRPDGDADAYSNGDCYCYSDGNGYCYSDGNGNAHGYSDGHSFSYSNAQTHAHAEVCADSKASSHTWAETVEIFATAKISSHRSSGIGAPLTGAHGVTRPTYKRERAPIW